jgi:hypothetical protein
MSDRREFLGNFLTEQYLVFVDGTEVDNISAGCWSDLEAVMKAAEDKLDEEIMAGKKILTRYINIEKNHIMFWTYKEDEWWTL